MAERKCRKCGAVAFGDDSMAAACPKCGAIYAKVESEIKRREEVAKAEEASRLAREQAQEAARLQREKSNEEASKKAAERKLLKQYVCLKCGSNGQPKKKARGHGVIEVALWLIAFGLFFSLIYIQMSVLFFLAALGYTLWRAFSRRTRICRACGSDEVIPSDTPKGRDALSERGLLGPRV